MSALDEKLAGVDQALSELGKSDEEISEVRRRVASADAADLQAVDEALGTLAEGVAFEQIARAPIPTEPTTAPEASEEDWDDEATEVEVIDESDFVLLVDEGELEELEKVGEDDAGMTRPPELPKAAAEGEAEGEGDAEGQDGFFKKLFGGKRTSSRPKPPGS